MTPPLSGTLKGKKEDKPEREEAMGTKWSEIISNHAMLEIDDVRLQEEAANDTAAFLRRMSLYMVNAIPLFSLPVQMRAYLADGLVQPVYGDFYWTSDEQSLTGETEVDTRMVGYELFSCAIVEQDVTGGMTAVPYTGASYNAETGVVTFPMQDMAGINYTLDFYTDGEFEHELTLEQKRILGLCVASVWDERFFRNWLNDQMKIKDASFDTVNEGTYMKEGAAKQEKNRARLMDEMHKYEQDCAFLNTVQRGRGGYGRYQFL